MPIRFIVLLLALALAGISAACGEQSEHAIRDVDEAADTLETPGGVESAAEKISEDVENSARFYDETYDSARKREGAIEAGGDAYDAVLDVPEEKTKKSLWLAERSASSGDLRTSSAARG